MLLTRVAKSLANSEKMSFAGQVDWKRMLTVCAVDTMGKPSATAPVEAAAARDRNLRRSGAPPFFMNSIWLSPWVCRYVGTRRRRGQARPRGSRGEGSARPFYARPGGAQQVSVTG